MKPYVKLVLTCAAIAGIAGLTACICINVKVSNAESAGAEKSAASGKGPIIIPPSPTSGILIPLVGDFTQGTSGTCFPKAEGWDRYFIITTNFLGPNTTPGPNCYTNDQNFTKVTVDTCDAANGTTLETGINIQQVPGTAKCRTNTPACAESSKLTINTRTMTSGAKYRAIIHYKSTTATGLTFIKVNWHYHN